VCRQIPEELRATWTAISGTERSNDAIRNSAWQIKSEEEDAADGRDANCMIKKGDISLLCILGRGGVYTRGHEFD
jgi:hypothetical protein